MNDDKTRRELFVRSAARSVSGEEPSEVTAFAHQPADDSRFREVPEGVVFTLRFPSGVLATCDCSFGAGESRHYRVHCAERFVEMAPAFSYRSLRLRTKSSKARGVHAAENVEVLIQEANHEAIAAGREATVRAWSPEGELAHA